MWWDWNVKHLPGQDRLSLASVAELSRSWIKDFGACEEDGADQQGRKILAKIPT
jgi:hypothetical protein